MSSSYVTLARVSQGRHEPCVTLVMEPSARWALRPLKDTGHLWSGPECGFAWGLTLRLGLCIRGRSPTDKTRFPPLSMCLIANDVDLDPCLGWCPPLPSTAHCEAAIYPSHPGGDSQGCVGVLAPCGGGRDGCFIRWWVLATTIVTMVSVADYCPHWSTDQLVFCRESCPHP